MNVECRLNSVITFNCSLYIYIKKKVINNVHNLHSIVRSQQ